MPLKQIPFIDEDVWELINPFLSQIHDPNNGGFQIYTESERPNNLVLEDVGKTIWNSTKGCFQRWSGGYWEDLSPKKPVIEDIVLQIINSWNPTILPQWLTNAINNAIQGLNIGILQSILDSWTPSTSALIRSVINTIATQVLNNGVTPIPTWLTNYVTGLITSATSGIIPLSQIQGALDSYWGNNALPYISGQDDLLKAYVDQQISQLNTNLTNDLNTKYAELLAAINTHTHNSSPTPVPTTSTTTPVSTTTPTTPVPTTTPVTLTNVNITLTQRPGTMRVSYVPPYNYGSQTGIKVVEAAFDISITYTGTATASSLAGTYFASLNSYVAPSGEKKVLAYGVTNIGVSASPYTVQNFYLPITSTSTAIPRKTWKYYVIKDSNGANYFQYDNSDNWNTFMSNYYLDHVEIPYGGFDTAAWLAFWDTLDANTKSLFPQS